jgi:hypothetical protein
MKNLVTNAIKFTRLEEKRHIIVSLGVALEQPIHDAEDHVAFLRTSEAAEAETLQADWKHGQIVGKFSCNPRRYVTNHVPKVYIVFSVKDTGRGLSSAERDLLFARFSQASPRTHIDYGKLAPFSPLWYIYLPDQYRRLRSRPLHLQAPYGDARRSNWLHVSTRRRKYLRILREEPQKHCAAAPK